MLGHTETLGPLTGCRMLVSCLVLFGAGGAIAVNVFGLSTCVRVPSGSECLVWVVQRALSQPCTSLHGELYTVKWFTSSEEEPRAMSYASFRLCKFIQGCKNNRVRFADPKPNMDAMPVKKQKLNIPVSFQCDNWAKPAETQLAYLPWLDLPLY